MSRPVRLLRCLLPCVVLLMALIGAIGPVEAASPTPPGQKPSPTVAEAQPPGLGLRFRYPAGWTVARVDGHTVLVSGPQGTEDWLTTLTISNQELPAAGGADQKAGAMITDYLAAIRARSGQHEVLQEAPFQFEGSGPGRGGAQAVVRFQGDDGPVRQWMVIVPRTDIPVAHVLLYSAPDDAFERGVPVVQRVLDSLVLLPARR
ncbi:hypothetical protein [Pararhodospirillum oryzae]|uniref:Uncharacterized protein n=1 Tax=Pararhodospirillum oryzae TaxID=478448 RepID=A0A512H5F3_9PROT|nr:hypothetical protein [Pararhodospirillum oryzae]GEO80663.1 hypothetical protein ROR02_07940 [Pararhodospirillum oryzae]